ncbi:MAG TPA: hypothetical protein DEQ61_12470, partial [Streptomyces sp.]|nr:hypothetical protein [Streptomyces sp.]
MPRSSVAAPRLPTPVPAARTGPATTGPGADTLVALLRRYGLGEPLSCERVAQGLLNRGYALVTTRGRYFLKHHLDGDSPAIARQHRATTRLRELGLPVAPPLGDTAGRTVAVLDGGCYALHPWIEGRHRYGTQLTPAESRHLGDLLGHAHTCLERIMPPVASDPRTPYGTGVTGPGVPDPGDRLRLPGPRRPPAPADP